MKTSRDLGGRLHVSMCVRERLCVCSLPFSLSEWFHLGNKLSSQICRCLQIVFCPEGKKQLTMIHLKQISYIVKREYLSLWETGLSAETVIASHLKIRAFPRNRLTDKIGGPLRSSHWPPSGSLPPMTLASWLVWNSCPQGQSYVSKTQINLR